MAPVLGYWDIRGLAQHIRLLLNHTNTEYVEKLYKCGPPPDYDKSVWLNEKFTLGLDFPNLPYYIDGDIKLTQSVAILRHLARKNKLDGNSEAEKVRIELVEQQLVDMNGAFVRMNYAGFGGGDFNSMKADYMKTMPASFELLSKFLGDRKWLAGDNLSYVDFMMYELVDKVTLFAPDEVKKFGNLVKHHNQVEELPNVKKFMQSDKFIKFPINGDMAKWGSRLNK